MRKKISGNSKWDTFYKTVQNCKSQQYTSKIILVGGKNNKEKQTIMEKNLEP